MDFGIKIPNVSPFFLIDQKDVLKTIGIAALEGILKQNQNTYSFESLLTKEFPEYSEELEPRSNSLIDEYIKFLKGNLSAYKDYVPFHFFPQWAFPIIGRSLSDLPFSFIQIMNAGYKIQINSHIGRNQNIFVRSKLIKIEQKKNYFYFTIRIISETKNSPEALVAHLTTLIRLPKQEKKENKQESTKKTEDYSIPFEAKEIASFQFSDKTGLDYAILTGDINPVHWLQFYAKFMGFKNVILHGFASSAFCIEAINNNLFSGNIFKIKEWEVKFTKPLILPAKPKLFYIKEENSIYLGDTKLSRAYLVGNFKT